MSEVATLKRTQSFRDGLGLLEEGRQPFRRRLLDSGRKQAAISAYVASLRRQAAITTKRCIFEKRSEHQTHLWSFGSAHNECEDEE